MPLMNNNYVSPGWIDNAAPPINDDELNAMSETLEGSQILVGSGAPTSSTPGKVGQRYADISTTPATIYRSNGQGFPGQPIPQAQTAEQLKTTGYRVGKLLQHDAELCVGASNNRAVTVLVYGKSAPGEDNRIDVLATCTESFTVYHTFVYGSGATGGVGGTGSGNTPDPTTGLYTAHFGAGVGYHETDEIEIYAPEYSGIDAALQAAANPPAVWEQEADPNRNTARPYSTGGSYAAGDFCIHEGKLWKALDATGGAWDGSKWERARYAEDLSAHVANEENPHNVTAAQTGAISPTVLATVQATTAAVRDYCTGEYFIYEGQLYELKEDVEQGGDLFGPRTPDTVSVYELDTWYEAELFDSNQPDAQVTQSGFLLTTYRTTGHQSTVMVESHAKYFYAWIQDASSTQSAMVYYSSDVNDFPNANLSTVTYYEKTNTAGLNAIWHGTVNRGIKAGEYYYLVFPQIFYPDLQTLVRRPVNARMFSGTESDLFNFISGTSTQKKSEPAVLGDGIAKLSPKTGSIALSAVWTGEDPYSQTATLTGATVTGKSKIDLTPTAAQLSQLAEDGVISLLIENNGGTLTAWAVGAQPSTAMTIACTATETV